MSYNSFSEGEVVNAGSTNSVKLAEQAWHDDWYEKNGWREYPENPAEFRELFYRVQLAPFCAGGWAYWGDARAEMMQLVGDLRGLKILDYGCGSGPLGIYVAMKGADVSGFDLSSKGIEIANWAARKYNLNCSFRVMDAESLEYPDQSFDLVIGFGVLHHVMKYPQSSLELERVLRPGGRAIFHETLWDNPLINFVRRWTVPDGDAGDAQLTGQFIRQFGTPFGRTRVYKHHILYMLKRLARLPNRDFSQPLIRRPFWRMIKQIDQVLIPLGLSRFCGEAVVAYTK